MAQINIQYTADIAQLNAKLDQIIKKQEEASESAKKLGKDISDSTRKAAVETDRFASAIGNLGGIIAAAFSVQKIIEFTNSLVNAERKMELLQNRLNFLAGSTSAGEQMFTRLESISRRLGLSLEDTAEGMASFGIAAKQAGFSAQQSEKIFTQVAAGLRAAGASSLQTQRSFYALQQMMSKGVVAAEELRRQLGESLPGASDLMTKAYNRLHPQQQVTNLEFTKMLESGKIISKDILPEFAKVIEETFAPALAGKANSLDAAINRVNNEFLKLKLNIGNASWFKAAANVISDSLFELNAILESDQLSALDKIYASLFAGDSESTKRTVGALGMIKTAVEEYNKEATQAIITNGVFGKALEDQEKKYRSMSDSQRKQKQKSVDDEILANEKLIKEADKLSVNERIRRNKEIEDAKSRNEFLRELRVQLHKAEEELSEEASKTSEQNKAAQQQALKDAVALAKIRVEKAQEGSIEENNARAALAVAQGKLDEFMAKSSAEAQLARVVAEKKVNEQIEESRRKTVDALSQDVVEDDIDPSQDPALKSIDKELETRQKNASKITQAIAKPYLDATDIEIAETILKYQELIALTKENSDERKQLEEALQKELQNIRDRAYEKEKKANEARIKDISRDVERIARTAADLMTSYMSAEQQIQKNFIQSQEQALAARVEAGLMSEEDYQGELKKLRMREFEMDKQQAITKAKIDTALSVINLFATMPWPIALALTPVMIGIGAKQVEAIQSMPMPTFHDGGVDIGGEGRITSGPLKPDEFIAKLQKGETIIDRPDTQKYKDELTAIRNGKFEDYIASKYILPALERSVDKKQGKSTQTSMEMAFQAAEMVNAIKGNKVIKLHKSSIKELAGQIKPNASDKILARRSWR